MTETAGYELEDGSVVHVQYQPDRQDGARQVGSRRAPQMIEERLPTVVGVAREILDAVREIGVDSAEVSFGITLTGGLNWAVAHASTEEMGPGWSWVRVDFPWSSNVSLHHKAALSWTPSQGPDDRRMVVHTSAEAAYADLVDWISRRETTNSDRRELLQRLQHADRSRQLIACCSHETVSPDVNPNFAPPAVVYCVYRVRQGTDARAVGWRFFTDWRRTMVYISPRSGRCMWHRTLPEGWSLHTMPLT
ncbi:CU044_2847 family protein [Microtetraspora malaysiensis]|uniref:CU044_2847 family protein n=1 Tax=Microtetraspora malaysiensis TaxID=161358 RepID=UPI003D949E2A